MGQARRIVLMIAVLAVLVAGCTSARGPGASSTPHRSTHARKDLASHSAASTTPRTRLRPPSSPATSQPVRRTRGVALPLPFAAGDARQVITAIAASTSNTRGTLAAWRKVPGGWQRVGRPVPAWFGSDGLTRHASESLSATPIGSFTLTQAFGRFADPGTALPYTRTTPADWWISQPGSLYNSRQRCSSDCPFTQGDPNEHLYYTVPYYRYAVVIDYNTRNSPTGVVQGAGSAFFLHVHPAGTGATAGCVAIPQWKLVRLMRWLSPASHPRILIGVG